jgi:hypothetical protein
MSGEAEFRIEFSIQRRKPGEEDFTEIGFGSSGAWSTPTEAVHIVESMVQNDCWETLPGMPDPSTVHGDD